MQSRSRDYKFNLSYTDVSAMNRGIIPGNETKLLLFTSLSTYEFETAYPLQVHCLLECCAA